MAGSSYYHLFLCTGETRKHLLQKLDFAGIAVTMGGSVTPFMYYGFMCDEVSWWRNFYLVEIWSMSILAMIVTLTPACKENNGIKAIVFLSAGYSCWPSLIHLTYYADPPLLSSHGPNPFRHLLRDLHFRWPSLRNKIS